MTQRWMPRTFTAPLREDFVSDGPKLRRFAELFWKTEDGKPLVLDPWQEWLLDAILERYPDDWHEESLRGRLRYRQVVIGIARQQGKSLIAGLLGMWALLMHNEGAYVIGIASNADQATVVYNRVRLAIHGHPALSKRFKATGTRGITRLDRAGWYKVKPAKADAIQGQVVTVGLADELHIMPEDLYDGMVLGTRAQPDGIVIGISTAGDDNSVLAKRLWTQGRDAVTQPETRFGFFLWEAPEGCEVDDPEALMDANPALVCGRLDMVAVQEDVRRMPEAAARRFVLNQFTSAQSAWLPMAMWHKGIYGPVPDGETIFAIDRTPNWEHATITATVKKDGDFYTEVVASIRKPNLEWLLNLCLALQKHSPTRFVMDGYTLGDLGKELERRGIPVKVLRQSDVTNACSTAYALIAQGKVKHNDDELLRRQMPFTVRKNVGDAWRISRAASSVDIDAVMATVFGLYTASIEQEAAMQLF